MKRRRVCGEILGALRGFRMTDQWLRKEAPARSASRRRVPRGTDRAKRRRRSDGRGIRGAPRLNHSVGGAGAGGDCRELPQGAASLSVGSSPVGLDRLRGGVGVGNGLIDRIRGVQVSRVSCIRVKTHAMFFYGAPSQISSRIVGFPGLDPIRWRSVFSVRAGLEDIC